MVHDIEHTVRHTARGSVRIDLLFTMNTEQAARVARRKLFSSSERKCQRRIVGQWWSRAESNRRPLQCDCSALPAELRPRNSVQHLGGAERDRTADPLLAKQVLSQLSYSP